MNRKEKRTKLLHHLGVGCGFLGLILWFFVGRELGVLDWAASLAPEGYSGAALMLGIMLIMTPAFALWTLFNRWLERKLTITGRYMEDDVYLPPKKR
ncbi:hypothetical protein [Marinobacterium mangrovicola]|uniref:Uncharacterized protein n=1 Tax=Marinobacterium mangrovicola TaxID=1476959 RepID=A0A4R1GKL3_9GAMM|nr:hypothetical protein [Marinobacterium mangrovicola]TCK08904.1 hypothetical protein CLV83_1000 [Marinobacterium mangrovicola]